MQGRLYEKWIALSPIVIFQLPEKDMKDTRDTELARGKKYL